MHDRRSSNPLESIIDAGIEVEGKAIGVLIDPFGLDDLDRGSRDEPTEAARTIEEQHAADEFGGYAHDNDDGTDEDNGSDDDEVDQKSGDYTAAILYGRPVEETRKDHEFNSLGALAESLAELEETSYKSNRPSTSRKASHRSRDYSTYVAFVDGLLDWISHGRGRTAETPDGRSFSKVEAKSEGDVGAFLFVTVGVLVVSIIIAFFVALNSEIERERPSNGSTARTIGEYKTINANDLNLRSGPGLSYPILQTLHRGDSVVVIGGVQRADGILWINVATSNGDSSGWLSKKFLSK